MRGVIYRFENSGYIRNTGITDPVKVQSAGVFETRLSEHVKDRGNDTYKGYRISALWHAADQLDIRLTAMRQKIEQDGFPTTDWRQSQFEQSRFARLDGSDENLFDDFKLPGRTMNTVSTGMSACSSSMRSAVLNRRIGFTRAGRPTCSRRNCAGPGMPMAAGVFWPARSTRTRNSASIRS